MSTELLRRIKAALTWSDPSTRPPYLMGPGADQVRAAQAMIRRLGARPPVSDGVPGSAFFREVLPPPDAPGRDEGAKEYRPSIANTEMHLRAAIPDQPRMDPKAESLAVAAADLSRLRGDVETLREGLRVGRASAADRIRGRALVREVEAMARAAVRPAATTSSAAASSRGRAGRAAVEAAARETGEDETIEGEVRDLAKAMLESVVASGSALKISNLRVSENAFHDFMEYRFLRDPNTLIGPDGGNDAGPLEQFLARARESITAVIEAFCLRNINTGSYVSRSLVPLFPYYEETIYKLFLNNAAQNLFELAAILQPGYTGTSGSIQNDVLTAFREWLKALVVNATFDPDTLEASFDNPEVWLQSAEMIQALFFQMFPTATWNPFVSDPIGAYSFAPFPVGIVNFGLRVVFRQEWRPLGTQPGEIVRTIPLGPKQVERVTTKVVRTDRTSSTSETTETTESSNESTSTAKDSSDVVKEASKNFKWHAEAEASGGFFGWSAKASAGASGEQASSSKDTKSRVNEAMQKTASKMTRSTKVVVSTEHTTTEEVSRASEITNPNDEIAVTYVYSKLQRQYEISTSMVEVNSVVFVPEIVPRYDEINEDWIRRHDWILAKALLDGSFSEDLNEIARDVPEVAPEGEATFAAAANTAQTVMGSFNALPGMLPDVFGSATSMYAQQLEKKRTAAMAQQRRNARSARLINHIRQNILHYMRAVWGEEDADQRLRRYARILVPTEWNFVPSVDPSTITPLEAELGVPGEFVPVYSATSMRPLSEIVIPAGPLGFAGNYAVFLLKGDRKLANTQQALSTMRAGYVKFAISIETAATAPYEAYVRAARHNEAFYTVTRAAGGWTCVLHTKNGDAAITPHADPSNTVIDFDGVRLRFGTAPAVGSSYEVTAVATAELEDPEIQMLREDRPRPSPQTEALVFSSAFLEEMAAMLPDVAVLFPSDLSGGWNALDDAAKQAVRGVYYRFLMTRDHTRRFLMETNNLILDIDVGGTPILEEFKRLHRCVDVLKELEEVIRRQLENSRRDKRIAASELDDPDIENMTIVNVPGGIPGPSDS